MVVNNHNWLLVTRLVWWKPAPKIFKKVGAVFLVGGLGGLKVEIARNTCPKSTNDSDGTASLIWVYHFDRLTGLLPAAQTTFGDAPEIYGHLVKVDDVTFV